jgi:RNA polymerase sigma-70 factor, ECF subfamily
VELLTNSDCPDSARDEPTVVISGSALESLNLSDESGRMLERCRQYLLMIANEVIGPELQAKLGPSDLVQDTFLEAQRHLAIFRGKTDVELRAWLRKILECRLSNIRRAYLVREKRAASREVTFNSFQDGSGAGIDSLKGRGPSPSNHAVRRRVEFRSGAGPDPTS